MRALIRLIGVVAGAVGQLCLAGSYTHVINEGAWRADVSPFECRLVNAVPFHGDAVFRRGAGEHEVTFHVEAANADMAAGVARVRAEAPVWNSAVGSAELGEVAVAASERPIQLSEKPAKAILAHLLAGREVVFAPDAANGQRGPLALTTVAFRRAYDAYLACVVNLLPANFAQLKRTAIYFNSGEPGEREELPEGELDKLDQILRYAEVDPYLREIYIDGHTDSVGLRDENLTLSEARARLVREYLVKRGMPEERIILRWHGERYPVKANDTATGRAQNRRVTLRLERIKEISIPSLATNATAPSERQP